MDENWKDFAAIIVSLAAAVGIIYYIWTSTPDLAVKISLTNLFLLLIFFIYLHVFFEKKKKKKELQK